METEWKDTFLKEGVRGEFSGPTFSKSRQIKIQSGGGKAVGGLSVN